MFLLDETALQDTMIGLNDSDEGILAKVYKTESEAVAKKDAAIKSKIDELDRLSPSDIDYDKRLEETVADLVKTIPESNRAALTHYVARRRLVLEIFSKDFASSIGSAKVRRKKRRRNIASQSDISTNLNSSRSK